MKIIVDADACPVKQIIENVAKEYAIELVFVANFHHVIKSLYAEIIIVEGDKEAADIAIANRTRAGDIVITQDYGLACLSLGKSAKVIHPDGKVYTDDNISQLLTQRHIANKMRVRSRIRGGPPKRTRNDDLEFELTLRRIINETV